MRWLAFAVLGACSFSPGAYSQTDASDGSDTSTPIDAEIDASIVMLDAGQDGLVLPDKVRSLDIVDAQVSGGPHADFPLLVSISDTWLKSATNLGDVLRDDGFDIYFSSDVLGATRLAHDVERYDPVGGTLVAWVKVPALTAQTVIYLHYGNPAITTSQEMVTSVWTAGYELVVHLDGSGDATAKNDSIPGVNLGVAFGKVGIARTFDGSTSYSDAGSAAAIDDTFATGGSIEGWFYPTGFGGGGFGRLFDKTSWGLFVDTTNATNSLSFYHNTTLGNGFGQWHFGTNTMSLNAWHHIAVLFDRDNPANVPTAVIDGVEVSATLDDTVGGTFVSDAASSLFLGNIEGGGRTFSGGLDELRVSSVARSTAWFITQYRNHNDPGAFYTVSAPL